MRDQRANSPTDLRPLPALEEPPDDVFDLIGRWQRYLEISGRCNEKVRRQYRRVLLAFYTDLWTSEWSRGHMPFDVTEEDIVDYLATLSAHGSARGTLLRALRSFHGWAADRDVGPNPVAHLTPRRQKYGPAPSISEASLDRVLQAAEDVDPRARWAIQLQYATCTRVGSLLGVMPDDIRSGDKGTSIRFRVAKGDKPYDVPLGPKGLEAAEKLIELIDYMPPKVVRRRPTLVGVGYNQYENWIVKIARATELDLNSHLLRHTPITVLAERNVDVRTIMELANWEDASLFRRYAAASDPNMRAAVDLL